MQILCALRCGRDSLPCRSRARPCGARRPADVNSVTSAAPEDAQMSSLKAPWANSSESAARETRADMAFPHVRSSGLDHSKGFSESLGMPMDNIWLFAATVWQAAHQARTHRARVESTGLLALEQCWWAEVGRRPRDQWELDTPAQTLDGRGGVLGSLQVLTFVASVRVLSKGSSWTAGGGPKWRTYARNVARHSSAPTSAGCKGPARRQVAHAPPLCGRCSLGAPDPGSGPRLNLSLCARCSSA